MSTEISSPAARMEELGHSIGEASSLAPAPHVEFVVQVWSFGRWAKWCSSLDTLADAEARIAAERKAVPFRTFRIVRATTTFEVIV